MMSGKKIVAKGADEAPWQISGQAHRCSAPERKEVFMAHPGSTLVADSNRCTLPILTLSRAYITIHILSFLCSQRTQSAYTRLLIRC